MLFSNNWRKNSLIKIYVSQHILSVATGLPGVCCAGGWEGCAERVAKAGAKECLAGVADGAVRCSLQSVCP